MALAGLPALGEVEPLVQAVNELLGTHELDEAMEKAQEAVVVGQQAKDKVTEAVALLLVAQVQLASEDLDEAMQTAKSAKMKFMTRGIEAGEGIAQGLIADVQFKALHNIYDPGAHKSAVRNTAGAYKQAIDLMHQAGVKTNALANAQTSLAALSLSTKDAKTAIPAAKEALDIYQELGDDAGSAEAALVLAEAHVLAGISEDYIRQQLILPPATAHAAAAGKCAEMARGFFEVLEDWDKYERAQAILDMEKVQTNAKFREVQFVYDTWALQSTVK